MYTHKVSTTASPRVEVTACQGDLDVRTWDKPEVLIKVDEQEALTVEERDDAVALVAHDDCRLTVPVGASLAILQVQGRLAVRGGNGAVEVATVQGDAQLRDGRGSASLNAVQGNLEVEGWTGKIVAEVVLGDAELQEVGGEVSLGAVHGDLTVEDVSGALSAQSVGGDAYLRQLHGPLSLDDVGADLVGRDWRAGANVTQVGGDAALKSVLAGPQAYRIQARGDVTVKALPGSDATFTLQAARGRIRAKGLAGEATEEGQWHGAIGAGEAQVTLTSSHGHISLKVVEEGEEKEEHVASAFAADLGEAGAVAGLAAEELARRIQQRVAEKLNKIDFEAIARREAERARRRAEREAARARRLAEKERRQARRSRRKKGVHWRFEWGPERSARRTARRGQASGEEERLFVLRMLAEGKISAEEAETLLQALES